jgi:hypothetical protein
MKIVEIVPRHRAHLYDTLVAKEAVIRKSGRGTYTRIGRKVRGSTRWLANRSFKISKAREAVSYISGSSSRRALRRPQKHMMKSSIRSGKW